MPITQSTAESDPRLAQLIDWLGNIEIVAGVDPVAASTDASFRRYFRLQTPAESFIAMDAPPAQEDSTSFLRVATYLESMQLNAPRVIEADLEKGFILLTDLGTHPYLDVLNQAPDRAEMMYVDAMRALLQMQERGTAFQATLPPYDDRLLRFELSLFHDWLCEKHLGIQFSAADEAAWQALCDALVANALDQPQVFVHRDYHSRNLMQTRENNPGILDFQDAVEGPYTYDLASLLKDCYVRWPADRVRNWALSFYAQLDDAAKAHSDAATFMMHFELMGIQRHLKAAGIFARLNHRDGKPGYMADIPRTLRYIVELAPRYARLGFLVELINERCLPQLENAD
jgi:aminoglycoside/choline kinase family phosphotransferase